MRGEYSTNTELLGRLCSRRGTDSEWRLFYDQYRKMIRNWCRQYGVNPSDLDDLFHDIMLRLMSSLGSYDANRGTKFRVWLRTVVTNTIIDRLRTANNSPSPTPIGDAHQIADSTHQSLSQSEVDVLAEQLTGATGSAANILAQAKRRVSESSWDAFIRRDLLDESAGTIADSIGIKKASVYQSVSRVRKVIKQESEKWFATEESQDLSE